MITSIKALMRRSWTFWGAILATLGSALTLAMEHVGAIQQLAAQLGAPAWVPTLIGLAGGMLAGYRRYRDDRTGDNPA